MATLNVTTVSRAGVNLTTAAQAADTGGADKWTGTGKEFLFISNGSGSSYTATFPIQAQTDGQTVPSRTVVIPAGDSALIGPFPPQLYNDGTKCVNVQHSATTSIKVLPLLLGN